MASADYINVDELRAWVGVRDSGADGMLAAAVTAASRQVDRICSRRFYADDTPAEVTFPGVAGRRLYLPAPWDIASTVGLAIAVDTDGDGVYETAWVDADRALSRPFGPTGEPWPYEWIETRVGSTRYWPCGTDAVRITALWGWPGDPPAPVKQATRLLAHEAVKAKDAPFGVSGSASLAPLDVRSNPMVVSMLAPYRKVVVGVA